VRPAQAGQDGSKTVANAKGSDSRSPYVTDYVGRGERIRTSDLLVPKPSSGSFQDVPQSSRTFGGPSALVEVLNPMMDD
jgi:hypothetical protein